MATLVDITGANWASEVTNSKDPVIIVCWASWNGPSKMALSTISDVADATSSPAKFARLDADTESSLASTLNVAALPQVLAFQKGVLQTRILGAQSKSHYQQVLKV